MSINEIDEESDCLGNPSSEDPSAGENVSSQGSSSSQEEKSPDLHWCPPGVLDEIFSSIVSQPEISLN